MNTANTGTTYKHWHLDTDNDHIAWLSFDRQGTSVNALNQDALHELSQILDSISNNLANYRGLIIQSAKAHGFIAGADIEQFPKLKDADEAFNFIRLGQQVFDKLAALNIPTVAMIEGFCLGGGLELALACRYRVAEDSDKTRLGLPEVLLGIHPGWGGTIRLPQLIGPIKAMDLILTGKTVSAKAAEKLGIVDAAVPKRQLLRAARYYILQKPEPRHATTLEALPNQKMVRPLLAKYLYQQLDKKISREHYPAPYAVVDQWVEDGASGEQAMINEAKSIGRLFLDDTSRQLIRVFFLRERLKSLAKGEKFDPKKVHVVGAGTMGGDIAAWCALRGMQVTLQDQKPEFIAPAIKRAYKLFKKKLKQPRLIQMAMDRLMPDPSGFGIKQADVIIEAIFENLEAKQALFKMIEAQAKSDAVLATNTSSIPLDEINTVLQKPERLVGIHFFNPVAMMELVEVVKGDKTSDKVFAQAMTFVGKLSRSPLPVKSSPGFLVNRVLMPYLMEAMIMLEEGVAPELIDQAALNFGMPMGPVELADTVGLDICLSVAENLSQHLGGKVPERLREMVSDKQLGRKTGQGFYRYDKKGKPVKNKIEGSIPVDITDRLIMRMLNESALCLREGVVADADLLDAGMIFGTGFAPFRGGPMHFAQALGADTVKAKLTELQQRYGERFKPDLAWDSLGSKSSSDFIQAKPAKKTKTQAKANKSVTDKSSEKHVTDR